MAIPIFCLKYVILFTPTDHAVIGRCGRMGKLELGSHTIRNC